MIKFLDKNGEVIHIDTGEPDLLNYPLAKDFPEGWRAENLELDELKILRPIVGGGRLKDPPHEIANKAWKSLEALIEILEEERGKKGELSQKIKDKLADKGGTK